MFVFWAGLCSLHKPVKCVNLCSSGNINQQFLNLCSSVWTEKQDQKTGKASLSTIVAIILNVTATRCLADYMNSKTSTKFAAGH